MNCSVPDHRIVGNYYMKCEILSSGSILCFSEFRIMLDKFINSLNNFDLMISELRTFQTYLYSPISLGVRNSDVLLY